MEGDLLQALNPERLRSFQHWLETTSITVTQVNGQRKYGGPPPDWSGPVPGLGCEVFIGSLPRDIFEDRLIPLFQSVAPLYEFRLMMNFSGQNRGFAYAKYGLPAHASAAIQALHQYPLQDAVRLIVKKSTEKRQLCLGELPASMSEDALLMSLHMLSDGVQGVTLKAPGPKGKGTCGLVLYSSHYFASMAKKMLVQAFKRQYGICISVRWFPGSSNSRREEREDSPSPLACLGPSHVPRAPPTPLHVPAQRAAHREPLPHPSLPLRPPLLSRVVGGPALPAWRRVQPSAVAEAHLRWLCEQLGLGLPFYDMHYHHTDGHLSFKYRVLIPGLPGPFCGTASILPRSGSSSMEDEARCIAAEQVIKAMTSA
ncbi:dead end protein 1 isoform X2 [Brachyhypopomus gauderio]|uniref:dead end protein 1 isoform X2 n=1 Tax=Brachyhypopomus gauderio TaxID=698409 RepID=UPI0040434DD7